MKHIILPTQIYDKKYVNKNNEIILYEHPHYYKEYNYNKKKLILLKASMLYYYDYLYDNDYNVKYCELNDNINKYYDKKYIIFDPVDDIQLPKGKKIILETPNFILTNNDMKEYQKKGKSYHLYGFYNYVKKKLKYLEKIKSHDMNNRNKYDNKIPIVDMPYNKEDEYYINEATKWVNKNFLNNIGNTKDFIFPISHKSAKKFLYHFLDNNFQYFGQYQDAIVQGENYMFHSVLSSSLNIGLIQPLEIVNEIKINYNSVNMASKEGYIRQICGWRELCRYTYKYVDFNNNYFNMKEKLNKQWYDGTTGMEPVDNAIKTSIETGYAHHIIRLMVIGNYMLLIEINPYDVFKWFMEIYIDAYIWVMNANVEMCTFATGGIVTRKPYLSSSNYILKMSDYKKGKWLEQWADLYYNFLKKHKEKLWQFRYHFKGLKNIN